MANIQPFNYQESTNIEEHNQIVNKVNEIVEVINNVNLDTINSEIANLKANATATDTEIVAIKNKDSQQDTEIDGITKNLVSNVTATFDNPSRELKISLGREASPSIDTTVVIPASSETGQYSAGNGITIDNYQIAVDSEVVALKTDIQSINTEITGITNKNTEQDTAIAGKVAISQGVENAGKVLGIGSDGNVTPVNAGGSSGGSGWEKVNLSNFPTDWTENDIVMIYLKINPTLIGPTPQTWQEALAYTGVKIEADSGTTFPIATARLQRVSRNASFVSPGNTVWTAYNMNILSYSSWNTGALINQSMYAHNGSSAYKGNMEQITTSNVSNYIDRIYRMKLD